MKALRPLNDVKFYHEAIAFLLVVANKGKVSKKMHERPGGSNGIVRRNESNFSCTKPSDDMNVRKARVIPVSNTVVLGSDHCN